VSDFGEAARRLGANPLRWRLGRQQVRKPRLDGVAAPAQRVIVGVGDRRRIVLVVALVVSSDFQRETHEFGFGLGSRQLLHRERRRL
jgi:hypothetical protein